MGTARQDLPEMSRACFPVSPPVNYEWQNERLRCKTLLEFYSVCDGEEIGSYSISSLTALEDPSSEWLADSPGLNLKPGRWLILGDHEFGHRRLWDARRDSL